MGTFDEDVDRIKRIIRNERFLNNLGPATGSHPAIYKNDWLDKYGLWMLYGLFIGAHWLFQ